MHPTGRRLPLGSRAGSRARRWRWGPRHGRLAASASGRRTPPEPRPPNRRVPPPPQVGITGQRWRRAGTGSSWRPPTTGGAPQSMTGLVGAGRDDAAMRYSVNVPNFGEFAAPEIFAEVARRAE